MNPELERIVRGKQRRRRQLAALPFPEKIRTLVRLQAMVAPIQRAKRRPTRVWSQPPLATSFPRDVRLP